MFAPCWGATRSLGTSPPCRVRPSKPWLISPGRSPSDGSQKWISQPGWSGPLPTSASTSSIAGQRCPLPADAVLLAAGNSTRIAAVGRGVPKPLLAVQGEPILVRNVRWLAGAGIRDIWVNVHYRGDLIRARSEERRVGKECRSRGAGAD